jgi:phosphate-selective porin OprO/OprP
MNHPATKNYFTRSLIALLMILLLSPAMVHASWLDEMAVSLENHVDSGGDTFKGYFIDGMTSDLTEPRFRYQLGGRFHGDAAIMPSDSAFDTAFSDPDDDAEVRRFRIFLNAGLFRKLFLRAQFDFAGTSQFKDVYLRLVNLPVIGKFQVGHFKEPFSLENRMSSRYQTFMENSVMDVFSPGRNIGIEIGNTLLSDRLTWATGLFGPTENITFSNFQVDEGLIVPLRLTALPVYQDRGRRLLHVGLGYRYSDGNTESKIRFRGRPEVHLAPTTLDTKSFQTDGTYFFNVELAAVWEAISVQAEYTLGNVTRGNGLSDANLDGYYIEASWFITGEHRNYKKRSAVFSKVRPKNNFLGGNKGWGAWQLALRYSSADLNDAGITGGEEDNWTLGLNWYLNSIVRMMFNYTHAEIENNITVQEANLDAFQFRLQVLY